MSWLLILFSFILTINSFSQEIRVSMNQGYAIGEIKGLKKLMLCTGVDGGAEFKISNGTYIHASPGIFRLRFSFTDTINASIFNNKYFLNIPVSIKKYYPLSRKSWSFWDFGIYAGYFFSDKQEKRTTLDDYVKKRSDLGWNFGGLVNIGFKTILTSRLSFDIGLSGQSDIFFSYKDESDRIKTNKTMLTFSIYRKL